MALSKAERSRVQHRSATCLHVHRVRVRCLPPPSPLQGPLPRTCQSRLFFLRSSFFGNDAKCHPKAMEQASIPQPSLHFHAPPALSIPSWGKRLLMPLDYEEDFGRCDVRTHLSLSLPGYLPEFPLFPPGMCQLVGCSSTGEGARQAQHKTVPVASACVSAMARAVSRENISFSNFQDRGDGSWLITGRV